MDPDQEYIYFIYSRKRFILPVTYFSTNLVNAFTLPVTGIKLLLFSLSFLNILVHVKLYHA